MPPDNMLLALPFELSTTKNPVPVIISRPAGVLKIGSNLKFDYKIDKELIGGLKLQLGSFMIDTSIKNKLKKFEQAMLED